MKTKVPAIDHARLFRAALEQQQKRQQKFYQEMRTKLHQDSLSKKPWTN